MLRKRVETTKTYHNFESNNPLMTRLAKDVVKRYVPDGFIKSYVRGQIYPKFINAKTNK